MQPVTVKVYGNLSPAGEAALAAVESVCASWSCDVQATLEGDLLRFFHEGVFFPDDDVAEALRPFMTPDSTGKIDVIDLEAWKLTRYTWPGGILQSRSRDINAVLDYSGH